MFGWLAKRRRAQAKKRYEAKLSEAIAAQRRGDIQGFAILSEEAEQLRIALDKA